MNPIKFLVAASLYVAATIAYAEVVDHAHTSSYHSIEDAVRSLSKCFHMRSRNEDTEYSAGIVSQGSRYRVVVEASEPGLDVGWLTIRLREGESFAGIWHTHGAHGFGREQFSKTDVALAKRFDIPMFLTSPKGFLLRYDPPTHARARKSTRVDGKKLGHVKHPDFVCETATANQLAMGHR